MTKLVGTPCKYFFLTNNASCNFKNLILQLHLEFCNSVSLFLVYETNLYYEALDVCFSKCKCFSMGYRPHDDECELTDALLFIASKPEERPQWKPVEWLLDIFFSMTPFTFFVNLSHKVGCHSLCISTHIDIMHYWVSN